MNDEVDDEEEPKSEASLEGFSEMVSMRQHDETEIQDHRIMELVCLVFNACPWCYYLESHVFV